MNLKIDVNVNLSNVEAIIGRMSKMMDLARLSSGTKDGLGNEPEGMKEIAEVVSDNNSYVADKEVELEEVTIDKLRYLLTDLSKVGKSQQVKLVLEKYDARKVSQLKKSDYNQIYLELSQLS